MRTEIRESLTGKTVQVAKGTPIVMTHWCVPEDMIVEVVSTWFSMHNTVEAVEVLINGKRVQLWSGFTPVGA